MTDAVRRRYKSYVSHRQDSNTFFAYGLKRRFAEICREFENLVEERDDVETEPIVTVVDFGCADGAILLGLVERFPNVVQRAIGIDTFRRYDPPNSNPPTIEFWKRDVSKELPLPISERTADFLIASAFLKHQAHPEAFLHECARILTSDGRMVLLDPTPMVIRVGTRLKYFDRRYSPFIWSPKSLAGLMTANNIPLQIVEARRYWIAPNQWLYQSRMENLIPRALRRHIGIHQCVVLKTLD